MAERAGKTIVPETHELIREEDLAELLEHLSNSENVTLPNFTQEHIDWIRIALAERKELCARQYGSNGSVDESVCKRLRELDGQLNGVSPVILQVLHFLSRIRAIIPALLTLQEEVKEIDPNPEMQMIKQMKYECSKAEVQSAVQGLVAYHIRPKILDRLARGETPE